MMIRELMRRLAFAALCLVILFGVVSAYAANIRVPATRLTDQSRLITANTLKPAACSALTLTRIVICTGGNCDGTNANELLLGTAGNERIRGQGGTDCVVGGGGDDRLEGNGGSSDVCIGGPGTDVFASCETTIQ